MTTTISTEIPAQLRAEIDEAIADQGPCFITAADTDIQLHCTAMMIVHVFQGRVNHAQAFAVASEWRNEAARFVG